LQGKNVEKSCTPFATAAQKRLGRLGPWNLGDGFLPYATFFRWG